MNNNIAQSVGFIVLFMAIVYIFVMLWRQYGESVYARSTINGKSYLIRRGRSKTQDYLVESANKLAELDDRVQRLVQHVDEKYKDDKEKRHFIDKLMENYHSNILSEAAVDTRFTTYTVDKNDMHICLRTRDENEHVYGANLLMYVVLHELAHLCNYSKNGIPIHGHGEEFKSIFKFLVLEAIEIGVYEYKNYVAQPESYCGIIINSTILPQDQYLMLKSRM
jgi:hypothetical protein